MLSTYTKLKKFFPVIAFFAIFFFNNFVPLAHATGLSFMTSSMTGDDTTYLFTDIGWNILNSFAAIFVFALGFITLLFSLWFFYHKARY